MAFYQEMCTRKGSVREKDTRQEVGQEFREKAEEFRLLLKGSVHMEGKLVSACCELCLGTRTS